MSIATPTAMRLAFETATADVPKNRRTALYAMVRSAVNRKVGVTYRRSMWSVGHGRR
jgi:hypothetical protein